jgi:Novel STAND NTPase 1
MGADDVATAPRIRLVYTIRADFANRLLSHRGFTDAIQDADVKIGSMNREELDSVIRRRASLRNDGRGAVNNVLARHPTAVSWQLEKFFGG